MELFRAMQKGTNGVPICGTGDLMLGARVPIDVRPDADGKVWPGRGGMSVTPGDPRRLPTHLRPEGLEKGTGRLPVFAIDLDALELFLAFRPDAKKPDKHGYVEPHGPMMLDDFQATLFRTAPHWREYRCEVRLLDIGNS